MKPKGINRVIMVVNSERFDKAVTFFSQLLGGTFQEIPAVAAYGLRATANWEAGIEVIAPLKGTDTPPDPVYLDFLEKCGGGAVWSCVLGRGCSPIPR